MPIGQFLNRGPDGEVNEALVEKLDELFGSSSAKISEYFYGPRDASGKRIPTGIWDIVSANLAAAASGNVVTLTAGARPDGVFAQTELPVLMGNQDVTSVDGIPMALLRRIGREEAFRLIVATSELATARLRLAVDTNGELIRVNGRFVVDTSQFLPHLLSSELPPLPAGASYRHLEQFLPEDRLRQHHITVLKFRNLVQKERALQTATDDANYSTTLSDLLKRFNEELKILEAAESLFQASRALQQGNLEKAKSHLSDYARSLLHSPLAPFGLAGGYAAAEATRGLLASWLNRTLEDLSRNVFGPSGLDSLGQMLHRLRNGFMDTLRRIFRFGELNRTPLVLDLDGNGVSTLSLQEAAVYFDLDNNGFAERTGWVAPADGLLVRDLDGDGAIFSGAELFGSATRLADGSLANHGFEALAALDDNGDGWIDGRDSIWPQLRIWRDGNGNALSDPGELIALDALQITALHLAHSISSSIDPQGNQHRLQGSYLLADDRQLALTDVWFAVDPTASRQLRPLPVPAAIAALPDLPGMGQVASLHQVMAADPASPLPTLLRQWIAGNSQQRRSLFLPIFFAWTGVQQIEPALPGGDPDDFRLLKALERLMGRPFAGTNWTFLPHSGTVGALFQAFPELRAQLEGLLVAQVDLPPLLNDLLLQAATVEAGFDGQSLWEHLERRFGAAPDGGLLQPMLAQLRELAPHGPAIVQSLLLACGGRLDPLSRTLVAVAPTNTVQLGGSGSDLLAGTALADWIEAHGGADTLVGGSGGDVLLGGTGDDRLVGDGGADLYLLRRGDGRDRVFDYSHGEEGLDWLEWLDVPSTEMGVERLGHDLLLRNNSGDELRVEHHFFQAYGLGPAHAIEQFRFSDGVVWGQAELRERVVVAGATAGADVLGGFGDMPNRIDGLGGDDTLQGSHFADRLLGGAGHDRLVGHGGHDHLDGGSGNDWIDAGEGQDTLVAGGGHDTLIGGAGNDLYLISRGRWRTRIEDHETFGLPGHRDEVRFRDLRSSELSRVERLGSDLQLQFRSGDELRVMNHFYDFYGLLPPASQIEQFRFSDGVVWGQAELQQRLATQAAL